MDRNLDSELMEFLQARFPERLKPGAFDVWGSSHQIFHVMVVFGAILHFNGILASLNYYYDPANSNVRQCPGSSSMLNSVDLGMLQA